MMNQTPILIYSDHPGAPTGLARVTRDLALMIHQEMPQFRVGTVGYGYPGSAELPFPQYHLEQRADFVFPELPFIWENFVGRGDGILLTIHDISRMLWLADPNYCQNPHLKDWIFRKRLDKSLQLWGYFPIDAHGKDGKLGLQMAHVLKGYDRRLAYTAWASDVISRTIEEPTPFIPHGINTEIFRPQDKESARGWFWSRVQSNVGWPKQMIPITGVGIGIVATNQIRKDFGLGIQAIYEFQKRTKKDVTVWIHTDTLKREWAILELLSDFELIDHSIVTTGTLPDSTMAQCYSAMNLTLGIGRGEGFGYPIFESIACDVPCIHGNYGGAAEFLPPFHLIQPSSMRIEGSWNLLRPVFEPWRWADAMKAALGMSVGLPGCLIMGNVMNQWQKWLREGLK